MRETETKGRFWHWGNLMFKFRWLVLCIWIVLLGVSAIFAVQAPGLLKDNGFTPKGSQSDVGLISLRDDFGFPGSVLNLVYESKTLDLTLDEHKQSILNELKDLQASPYVDHIEFTKTPRSDEGLKKTGVQTVDVMINLPSEEVLEHYPGITKLVKAPDQMSVYIAGGTASLYDMQEASKSDIVKAEMIGLPIAFIVLLLVFGTVAGALLPLAVGMVSVSMTLGITYFIAQGYAMSNFLPNLVSMLGLAVGIDYALFMVSRFREELKKQSTVSEAVAMTCQTAGKSIFFSGIAVLIGLLGMLFIDMNFFRSLSIGGIIVVSMSVLVANTMLMALFAVLGDRINKLKVIPTSWRRKNPSQFWEKIAYGVMKRPILLTVVISGVLIYAITPLAGIKLGVPTSEVLPPSYGSRYGSELMKSTYNMKETDAFQVIVKAQGQYWEESTIKQVRSYVEQLERTTGIAEVRSYVQAVKGMPEREASLALQNPQMQQQLEANKIIRGNQMLVVAVPNTEPGEKTEKLVPTIRALSEEGLETIVTGAPAYRYDVIDRIQSKLVLVVSSVLAVTFVVLMFAFRSIILPIKAVIMNVFSLGASLGIVTLIFQKGYMADLFHITSIGSINATLPVIIFCVVFGISMDYEVFLISRIQEEYENTGDNDRSTAEGLKKTGSLITSAAFILIAVVGSFIFTDIEIMKAVGIGLGLAVLIDATIIRVLLVPALMKLMGTANWWAPKWLRRSEK
ncbi:MMPL family transporter [Paenibacillus sp. N1-5-1-14]|uniref:MMPL family transporter n=1 Tax=Paenibacillus radicibacter TaxID=2972488 RepID=UPI00215963B8|nr:MMPL family transporter [Paenibacillus radicibacter]MCR8643681.1 MMPL family transporter [Paenibacillus radicibacter]